MQLTTQAETQEILSYLQRAAAIAVRMLPRMLWREGQQAGLFCHKLASTGAHGQLQMTGASIRYSAIALIGIGAWGGKDALGDGEWKPALNRLAALVAEDQLGAPELGLLLWLDAYLEGEWAPTLLAALQRRWSREAKALDTMERAYVLAGLARRLRCSGQLVGGAESDLLEQVKSAVLAAYRPDARLFALAGSPGLPWRGRRYRSLLGSFASQVYPLVGLSAYLQVRDDSQVKAIVQDAAQQMCALQGPQGEWWWIFDTRTAMVFLPYPVYSVHQDAMGPMALLAAGGVLGTDQFWPALANGLRYLFAYRHLQSGAGFVDEELGLIWRALVKDVPGEDPADLPFGLGSADWERMQAVGSWKRSHNGDNWQRGYRLLYEARPYCAGWILYACALAREEFAGNADG